MAREVGTAQVPCQSARLAYTAGESTDCSCRARPAFWLMLQMTPGVLMWNSSPLYSFKRYLPVRLLWFWARKAIDHLLRSSTVLWGRNQKLSAFLTGLSNFFFHVPLLCGTIWSYLAFLYPKSYRSSCSHQLLTFKNFFLDIVLSN